MTDKRVPTKPPQPEHVPLRESTRDSPVSTPPERKLAPDNPPPPPPPRKDGK